MGATAGNQILRKLTESLNTGGSQNSLTKADSAEITAACAASDVQTDNALRGAVELEFQLSLLVASGPEGLEETIEKRIWSEWLRMNVPPTDYQMTGVAGHPNLDLRSSEVARLDAL